MKGAMIVAAVAVALYVLLHSSIPVPALSFVGTAAGALFATVPALSFVGFFAGALFAACVACTRRSVPREQLRRYRTPEGALS
jgi:hypothetical protein